MTIRPLLFGLFLVGSLVSHGQTREAAFGMNDRLGRGVNIGNTFEAPSEDEWGNPWKAAYFKNIAALGFNHVRLPIRWEPQQRSDGAPPYTINPSFLERIKEVVDSALRYKLHIIINMHHHEALFDDPDGQKERFLSQWNQIATYFRNYSDSLLFEVLNEPHGNVTPAVWNEYFSDALEEIRKTNPVRTVLMGVAEYGGLSGVPELVIPDDENIILTIHYYNPFVFTHQGAEWVEGADAWLGTQWWDTEAERQTVEAEFAYALQFARDRNVPVHIGEFGAYSKADTQSRLRWTTFLSRWFEENELSWAYWEYSSGFGIFNLTTQQHDAQLVDALLHNEMPDPTPVVSKPVYNSNFSSGTDGWTLIRQVGVAADLSASNNRLNVTISNGGQEAWHLQLIRNGIRLENGKLYRLSFRARAGEDRGITFYAGRAQSPWNSYSGYQGVTISNTEAEYSSSFTMQDATDPAARLVFDLGNHSADVSVWNIAVEELSFAVTGIDNNDNGVEISPIQLYPNPTQSYFRIDNIDRFQVAQLFNVNGQLVGTFRVIDGSILVDLVHQSQGLYLLSLSGPERTIKLRVVKKN